MAHTAHTAQFLLRVKYNQVATVQDLLYHEQIDYTLKADKKTFAVKCENHLWHAADLLLDLHGINAEAKIF